ncbi:MAG: serine/threonine-protein phosphatase, partial [Actinomycetota bacterium]|nr:serine/threonine-protein phosphatase [Actinomycetota bacterium]
AGDPASEPLPAPAASAVAAPLVARGTVLGVATFTRIRGSRPFDEQDVALAAEIAARAAIAIDNARLYAREKAVAVALQRSLLPQERPRLTAVDVAHRYLPGSVVTEVGGDWFDVIPLSCGRVALVIGDVMGRGVRAAAAMGQLRTAVRTLAVLDPMPDDALTHLDDLAQSLDQVQLATCIYAVYDPATRRLRYASAGHLPPAVVTPDGTATYLPLPSGAPLGVGGVPFENAVIPLPDGSRIALYTDGLVESREEDLDEGLLALQGVLGGQDEDLELICDRTLDQLGRADAHHDDVALLVARVHGLPGERMARWMVPSDLSAVARARDHTASTLSQWGLEALCDTATLLVSETVTNAIRYARDPIELRILLLDDALAVAVHDSDTRLPRLRRAREDDEGGRGLHLVGMLAHRWGTRATANGKVVWFELGARR